MKTVGDNTNKLRDLLIDIQQRADSETFLGTGIIVYSDLDALSFVSISNCATKPAPNELVGQVLEASSMTRASHDGFHFIDSEWHLTHLNQYVAPEIPKNYQLPPDVRSFAGARFTTAILSSLSTSVICSGILSSTYGIMTFADGRRVH